MDNNKNQRLVNYLSAILLIGVIVIVSYTIYTQQPKQEPIISTTTTTKPLGFFAPGREHVFSIGSILSLLNYFGLEVPENFSGDAISLLNIMNTSEKQVKARRFFELFFTDAINEQPKNDLYPIRELVISIRSINDDNDIKVMFSNFSNPGGLKGGDLVMFGVNGQDILKYKRVPYAQDDVFYFCDVIIPPLSPLPLENSYTDNIIKFANERIFCSDGFEMKPEYLKYLNWWWLGILNNDSYKVKIYLVDENTRSEIQKSSSFSEAEEILNNYQLLYEKNISFK